MSLEISSDKVVCTKCGMGHSRRKGNFPVSYALLHKGIGFIPVCKECIDNMYNGYLSQCNNAKDAVRQVCRKLDLYWNEKLYDVVSRTNTTRSMMTQYIAKTNSVTYAGKCYDDTLSEEGTLWSFEVVEQNSVTSGAGIENHEGQEDEERVPEEVIAFWGSGYSPSMYAELEQRRTYYMSKFPKDTEFDVGFEALIRQICNLEVNIAKDSAAGKSIDKSVNSLNTLLGSLNLKPTQLKNDDIETELSTTPLGVWLYRYENKKPLPEIDESLRDVNHIKKYLFTWMGHVCKMLGVKNGYTRLYEDEVARLRVDKPEYEDEDEESLLIDAYSESPGNE